MLLLAINPAWFAAAASIVGTLGLPFSIFIWKKIGAVDGLMTGQADLSKDFKVLSSDFKSLSDSVKDHGALDDARFQSHGERIARIEGTVYGKDALELAPRRAGGNSSDHGGMP